MTGNSFGLLTHPRQKLSSPGLHGRLQASHTDRGEVVKWNCLIPDLFYSRIQFLSNTEILLPMIVSPYNHPLKSGARYSSWIQGLIVHCASI